mgnify:FL=1
MRSDTLPSFIVIGAVKAATTWIAHQLQQHPKVFLPGPEPHFFSTEYGRGVEWYRSWFNAAPSGSVVGEKSADYLAHPEAAKRMFDILPSARLIAQLRNPVDRAYSDYCMLYRRGTVAGDPERYLNHANPESARFLEYGLYARHLSRFLNHFERGQLLVVLHEDVARRPETVIADVCRHIRVEPKFNPHEVMKRVKNSESPSLPLALRRALRPFKEAVAPLRDRNWFKGLHGLFARPTTYPPMTDTLRQRLQDYYLPDIQNLEQILGRDMTPWLTKKSSMTEPA